MTIKVEIAILRGCRMNMQFVFVEVYFNNLYRDPFLFVKRGIKKMLNFPYEVQHISLFLIIDQRYFEKKIVSSSSMRRSRNPLWFSQLSVTTNYRRNTFPKKIYRYLIADIEFQLLFCQHVILI